MKIPQALVQDKNQHRLFIVTGKQVGVLYDAHGNAIEEIARVEIETPKYSDREGMFGMPGKGTLAGRGGVYENKDEETIQKFTRALAVAIKEATERQAFAELHLFTPNYMIHTLMEALPVQAQAIFKESFHGNFTKFPVTVLAEKIEARNEALKKESEVDRMHGVEARIMQNIPRSRETSNAHEHRGLWRN